MRRFTTALALAAMAATTGCALAGHQKSRTPDEFAVARNAPLIIPPDFSLTPPVAGTAGLTAGEAQQQAIDALFGGPAPRSASESMILDQAARERAQIGIRSNVWDPDTRVVDKGATTLNILGARAGDSNIASAQAGQ